MRIAIITLTTVLGLCLGSLQLREQRGMTPAVIQVQR